MASAPQVSTASPAPTTVPGSRPALTPEQAKERYELERNKMLIDTRASHVRLQRDELELQRLRLDVQARHATPDMQRRLHFFGPVDEESVKEAIERLETWSRRDPGEPIEIVFNSPGGLVIEGLALFDHILDLRSRGHHVTTIARGQASSMGGVLLQSGNTRIIGRNAMLLVHEVSSGMFGKTSMLEDRMDFNKKLSDRLLAILAERSKLTVPEIRERWHKLDWWLTAPQAVKLGFADKVG